MKNTASFRSPGGTVTISLDIDTDGTHRKVRESIEAVFAEYAEVIKDRARAKAPNAIFQIKDGQKIHMKATFDVFRIKSKGKNITNKTDKFVVEVGEGVYPDKPKSLPKNVLAKPAHVELGTRNNAPMPFMYPAYDQTRAEILGALEELI